MLFQSLMKELHWATKLWGSVVYVNFQSFLYALLFADSKNHPTFILASTVIP